MSDEQIEVWVSALDNGVRGGVVIRFAVPVEFFGLSRDNAIAFAEAIRKCAECCTEEGGKLQ